MLEKLRWKLDRLPNDIHYSFVPKNRSLIMFAECHKILL